MKWLKKVINWMFCTHEKREKVRRSTIYGGGTGFVSRCKKCGYIWK